jgi:hypothetical protein
MPTFTIIAGLWRKILERVRPPHLSETEQREDHCLEGMLHWHDPNERLRALRCRCGRHALVDDNPASG